METYCEKCGKDVEVLSRQTNSRHWYATPVDAAGHELDLEKP